MRKGALVPLDRGVYALAATARQFSAVPNGDHVLRAAAALAVARWRAVVSHRSAALVHEIDILGNRETLVTVTTLVPLGRRGRDGVHVYSTELPASQVTRRYGIPVTTVARTVVDLARTRPFADGVVAADSALRKRLTSKRELRAVLATCPRSRGVAQAARVVEFANGLSESPLESLARVAFRDCGLPAPKLQVWLGDEDGVIGRVDFYWAEYKTVAEVDGALKYETPARALEQLRRDKRLREAGYEVVHFDWREITTAPEQVAASVRAAFRRGKRGASGPAA